MRTKLSWQVENPIHRRRKLIAVVMCLLLFGVAQAAPPPRYVEGELLLKFKDGPSGVAAQLVRDRMKHEVKRNFDFVGWQQIRLPHGMSVEEGLARYRNVPGILAVEPNFIAEGPEPIVDPVLVARDEAAAALIPNDSRFAEQYGLAKIQAANAWEVSTGDSNVVVAIIDTGINYDHEDLAANMWRNPGEIPGNKVDDDGNGHVDDVYGIDTADDFFGNDSDPRDQGNPNFYHGSACAGVIGAIANNSLGIAGLNWNVQLMAIRAIKTNNNVSGADALDGYAYVALMKDRGVNIKVINMSYGGTGFGQAAYDALSQLAARGILAAAAAHNQTNDNDLLPRYPASYDIPGLIAVAATDQDDNLATFSNWGRTSVDLAAPGVGILMTGGPGPNVYRTGNGTSFATPHVVGSAALCFAAYPNATPEDVKVALLESVDLIPALTNFVVSHGRLNVGRAMIQSHLNGPPAIYREPQNQLAVLSHSATFEVGVRGKSPLAYQWFFGSAQIPGATNDVLTFNNLTFAEEGDYTVVVTNVLGAVTSQVTVLTIAPLLIATQPQDQSVRLGAAADFFVAALSPEPLSYRWFFEGSPLLESTNFNFAVTNVQFTDEGYYTVVVSNSYTSVTSAPARLKVLIGPSQHAYVKASNPGANDNFGWAAAVSGDTMVIGAYLEDGGATGVNGNQNDNSATNAGAAYVFVRDGDTWIQQAYLKASNTDGNDQFGTEVAISGDTIVIGAPTEDSGATGVNGNQNDNSATNSGAAYVFVRDGTNWTQQAYLKASNTGPADNFGFHVAIVDDTVVVGAWLEDSSATGINGNQSDNSSTNSGAAYVFVRSGTNWTQQAYFKASNTGLIDQFGVRVSVSGDTIVVSANLEDSNSIGVNGNQYDDNALNSGAAYVFVRNGTNWAQQAYLKASNTEASDNFGISASVAGDTVVIGAGQEGSNATGVNGDQNNNGALASGAAYVYVRNGTNWIQQAYLKASNTGADDRFGRSATISGDTVVVGGRSEDSGATGVNGNQNDNSVLNAGAAYVFVRDGTNWTQQGYLKASNTGTNDEFGFTVAVSGDTVVATAYLEDGGAAGVNGNQSDNSISASGAAYIFTDFGPERPPLIVVQPRSQTVLLGQKAAFQVEASGKNPLAYQWYFDAAHVPNATNRSLSLNDLDLDASGNYSVVVTNALGATTSQVAVLTVSPLLLVEHPRSQGVSPSSNVTFSVSALSPEPPAYQWLFNNSPITGAIDSNLTVSNVQLTNEGLYAVVVGNSFLSVTSNPAKLSVLIRPVFIQSPLSQSVAPGGSVTLSAAITGYPAPFGFQWRRGTTLLTTIVQTNRECFFTVSNVQSTAIYRVMVTNAAAPTFTIFATCTISVQTDANTNGLPDPWEQLYGVSDPLADPDQDFLTNLQEYKAGTNPTNALSALRLDNLTFDTEHAVLEFTAVSNKTYTVEYTDQLAAPSWHKLADTVAGATNRVEQIIDAGPPPAGERFYRLLTPRRSD